MTARASGGPSGTRAVLRYPEVHEEAAAPGDVHPLDREDITHVLHMLPFLYIAGLKRIELRPRKSDRIGEPFGCYWRNERAVILYSLPKVWRLEGASAGFLRSLALFDAEHHDRRDHVVVSWPKPGSMSLWYYTHVLAHELIHHYLGQYREDDGLADDTDHVALARTLHGADYMDMLAKHIVAKERSAG